MRTRSWIAAQVRMRSEFSVSATLREKGYETFLPTYVSVRKWSDRDKVCRLPLISGYVFVRVVPDQTHGPVATTPGVMRVVGFGGKVALIEDLEVERLKAVDTSSLEAEPWEFVKEGTQVNIIGGALTGVSGTLLQVRNKTLLILSIDMLHRSVAVHIDRSWVQAVPSNSGSPAL